MPRQRSRGARPRLRGCAASRAPTAARASATTCVVAYLVECAHHVARQHRRAVPGARRAAHRLSRAAIRAPTRIGCIEAMCTHPNVGAVLLVSLGCEEFRRSALLRRPCAQSGRPAELLVIQDGRRDGGDDRRRPRLGRGAARRAPRAPDRADRASPIWSSAPNAAARTGSQRHHRQSRRRRTPSTGSSMPARR